MKLHLQIGTFVLFVICISGLCCSGRSNPGVSEGAKNRGDASEETIPYEIVENEERPDGKCLMQLVVSETASQQEVLKLAEILRQKYTGKLGSICVFDSREALRRRLDAAYPEKELIRHWLIEIEGDTGPEHVKWIAEGRDH